MPTQLHDIPATTALFPASAPITITAGGETSPVDMQDTDGPCFAIQAAGQVNGSVLHGRFQESFNGGSWADVPGGAFAAVAGGDSLQIVSFVRTLRFLKYVYNFNDGESGTGLIVAMVGAQKKLIA